MLREVCIITACNRLLFKETVTKSICILASKCVCRWWGITKAFKLIQVYIQHSFRCLINETVNHINLVLLVACSTNNGKIVASITLRQWSHKIWPYSRKLVKGQLLLQYQFKYPIYNDDVCSKLSLTLKWICCYKEILTSTRFPHYNHLVKENIIQMVLKCYWSKCIQQFKFI